jgi:multisubunit Na+/H+ antiporter MnhB subunit
VARLITKYLVLLIGSILATAFRILLKKRFPKLASFGWMLVLVLGLGFILLLAWVLVFSKTSLE